MKKNIIIGLIIILIVLGTTATAILASTRVFETYTEVLQWDGLRAKVYRVIDTVLNIVCYGFSGRTGVDCVSLD